MQIVAVLFLGMVACGGGGGGSYSAINGYMAGSWDFTVTNAKGHVPVVIEANLTQHHGNISATGSVSANGPAGNAFDVFIWGPSLSATYAVSVDYLGFTCNGTDSGDRSITGTIQFLEPGDAPPECRRHRGRDDHGNHEQLCDPTFYWNAY